MAESYIQAQGLEMDPKGSSSESVEKITALRTKHKFKRYGQYQKELPQEQDWKAFADWKPPLTNQHGQVSTSGWQPVYKVSAWFLLPKKSLWIL